VTTNRDREFDPTRTTGTTGLTGTTGTTGTTGMPGTTTTGSQDRMQQAANKADELKDKALDKADELKDKALDKADELKDRAAQAGQQANERIDSAMTATGERLTDLAQTVRERAPAGQAGDVAHNAARALERGGEYLQRADPTMVRNDLENMIREHPIEALAIGLGIGFLLGKSMSGSNNRRNYYG